MSELAKRIAARKRAIHTFDVSELFGLELPPLRVRVPVKGEIDAATIDAYKALDTDAKGTDAKDEIKGDRITLYHLHAACVDVEGDKVRPAFPSPAWMAEHLSAEELGYLTNVVNEARARESKTPPFDARTADALLNMAIEAGDKRDARELMATLGREYVIELFVYAARELGEARARIAAYDAELAALEQTTHEHDDEQTSASEAPLVP